MATCPAHVAGSPIGQHNITQGGSVGGRVSPSHCTRVTPLVDWASVVCIIQLCMKCTSSVQCMLLSWWTAE